MSAEIKISAEAKSKTDQELALAVAKAVDAYNQHLADAQKQADKLEADVNAAMTSAGICGLVIEYKGRLSDWPHSPYRGLKFSRTTEIAVPGGDRKA